jgi:phage gp16-like protein
MARKRTTIDVLRKSNSAGKKKKVTHHDVVGNFDSHGSFSSPSMARSIVVPITVISHMTTIQNMRRLDLLDQLGCIPLHQRLQRLSLLKKIYGCLSTYAKTASLDQIHDKVEVVTNQRTFGILVANLGYELTYSHRHSHRTLHESVANEEEAVEDSICVLVECLEHWYQCHKRYQQYHHQTTELDGAEMDAMMLLSQVLYFATRKQQASQPSQTTPTDTMTALILTTLSCLNAILTWCPIELMSHNDSKSSSANAKSCFEDDLILMLIRLIGASDDDSNNANHRSSSVVSEEAKIKATVAAKARNALGMFRSITHTPTLSSTHHQESISTIRSSEKCQLAWEALNVGKWATKDAIPNQLPATLEGAAIPGHIERKIFYWRCLAQMPQRRKCNGDLLFSLAVVDELAKATLECGSKANNKLASDAADCLSDVAKCCPTVTDCDPSRDPHAPSSTYGLHLSEALLSILTANSTLCVTVKQSALPGLMSLQYLDPIVLTKLLAKVHIPNLLQSLRQVVVQENTVVNSFEDTHCFYGKRSASQAAFDATRLLCYLSCYFNENFDERKQESILAIRNLSAILIHNKKNPCITLEVVRTISQFITKYIHIPKVVGSPSTAVGHDLLSALAHVVLSPPSVMPAAAISIAVQSLWYLSQHPTCHLALVRHSQVLEALIKIAATALSMDEDDSGNNRIIPASGSTSPRPDDVAEEQLDHKMTTSLALEALVRLSSNVVNRRLLAKQVGLLSCLIRWARYNHNSSYWRTLETSHGAEHATSIPGAENRQQLKDCIAHLAAVL